MDIQLDWYSIYTVNSCSKVWKAVGNINFDNLSTKACFSKACKGSCWEPVTYSAVGFLLVRIDQSTILSAESVCFEKMYIFQFEEKKSKSKISFVPVVVQRLRVSNRNEETGTQLFLT